MRKRVSYCYELHPVLAAFSAQWSTLSASPIPLLAPVKSLSCLAPALMLYRDSPSAKLSDQADSQTRQILGPLLPVLYWDSLSAVPDGVHWQKCELDDDAVVSTLIGEWLRWIILGADPVFAELCRQVFAHILDTRQCQQQFGVPRLSQHAWAQRVGLSRGQLAHAAATLKQQQLASAAIVTADKDPALNFFKARYGR